jgi:hypothetical protein
MSGSTQMSVSFTCDIFDEGEDNWAIRIVSSTWPSDTSACTQAYQIRMST